MTYVRICDFEVNAFNRVVAEYHIGARKIMWRLVHPGGVNNLHHPEVAKLKQFAKWYSDFGAGRTRSTERIKELLTPGPDGSLEFKIRMIVSEGEVRVDYLVAAFDVSLSEKQINTPEHNA